MYLADVSTLPPSLAGVPAMSLPCGLDSRGLPIGLQLVAPAFEESRLFAVAHAIETLVGRLTLPELS
jgi:aspartyl-tRNA(Asn)/glutamyl-tRNA(Gln) amidotransferase subunit A